MIRDKINRKGWFKRKICTCVFIHIYILFIYLVMVVTLNHFCGLRDNANLLLTRVR